MSSTGKLIVAGCSFSDYLELNHTVYGEVLAQLLDRQYIHQGAGCGSNWRIWRVIGHMIMQGEITHRDRLIVQYTAPERREFWSRFPNKHPALPKTKTSPAREPYDHGYIIRYKSGSDQWQDHHRESVFFRSYEENHLSLAYEHQWFELQHLMFQHLLNQYSIPTVFITSRCSIDDYWVELIEPHAEHRFVESFEFKSCGLNWYTATDSSHLCDHGHRALADMLYQHMISMGLA